MKFFFKTLISDYILELIENILRTTTSDPISINPTLKLIVNLALTIAN